MNITICQLSAVAIGLGVFGMLLFGTIPVYGQRGLGDPRGIAQAVIKPVTVALTGRITAINTGPCELTTGHGRVGTHLMVQGPEGPPWNLHVGPTTVVASIVQALPKNQPVHFTVFRTAAMKPDHWVVQSIKTVDHEYTLRDQSLRPVWAGSQPKQ
jgi:hypothetical protein